MAVLGTSDSCILSNRRRLDAARAKSKRQLAWGKWKMSTSRCSSTYLPSTLFSLPFSDAKRKTSDLRCPPGSGAKTGVEQWMATV
jgi:hypothetical protein